MTIAQIMQAVIAVATAIMENCPEPVEQKRKFLRAPSLIQWARFEIGLRREGLNRSERKQAREIAEQLQKDATDSDIDELIAAAAAGAVAT